MNQKGVIGLYLLISLIIFSGIILFIPWPYYEAGPVLCKVNQTEGCPQRGWNLGSSLWVKILQRSTPSTERAKEVCTMEAKICPDGSFVGRTGANCEFSPCPSNIQTPVIDETASWKTYANKEQGFSFSYPESIDLKELQDKSILLSLWGPTQKVNTEFYDGISLNVATGSLNNKTLQVFILDKIKDIENASVSSITVQPTKIKIGDREGITYTESGMGVFMHIYLPLKQNQYLLITNSTSDPMGKGFQQTVDQILSTFKFN